MSRAVGLTLIPGGKEAFTRGSCRVHLVADDEALPMHVDALVVEQDRFLALTPPREILVEDNSVLRTTHQAFNARRADIGSAVTVTAGPPLQLAAVVVDVDAEPICQAAWVESATTAVLTAAAAAGRRCVRLPLLGTAHGRLDAAASAQAIGRAVATMSAPALDIVVVVARPLLATARDALAGHASPAV